MYFLALISVITLTLWYIYSRKQTRYKLPPGPCGLPLIGNIHQLMVKNPFDKFHQWAYKYKKIYTINLCTKQAVVINDPKLMRDILSTFASTGKFQTDTLMRISQGAYGVLNSDGETWSEQKQFCLKKLKEFGFGNKRMETLILNEANGVCDWITKQNEQNDGKSLVIKSILIHSIINTVWSLVSDRRVTLGDSKMTQLLDAWSDTFQHTMRTGLAFLPWLKYLAPGYSGYTAYNNACLDVLKYIEMEFEEHKTTFIKGVQRDLIDAYIEESDNDPLKWRHAVATIVELFIAAAETTALTTTWLLFYVSVNPEIQLQLQKEIDMVVGDNEEISLDFKSRMVYTQAVTLETLRMSSLLPLGNMHRLLEDLQIDNYILPKDLILIPNVYHCHYNKEVWTDPNVFRPQRFLDDKSGKLKDHVVSFQLGKRQCVGEPLAIDMMFINVTRIFQSFNVFPDRNVNMEEYYKPDVGFGLFPPSLGLIFKPRTT